MQSGDCPGLQNRRAAGHPVAGAFDSHTLPPKIGGSLSMHTSTLPLRSTPDAASSFFPNWYKIFLRVKSRHTIAASLPLNQRFSCAQGVKG
jgi:hypothetical protein